MSDAISRLNAALSDRYRIERQLGEGGMATVYLADDLKHERKVALKVLKPELAAVVGAERFLAEIKTTANLQHPHILPLHDSGQADSFLFYVMPYVEGESLRDRLDREHQLPVDEAVQIAKNVAEALDYAHGKGVIHRDIKPANILLLQGKPVLSDFGIALAVGAAGGGRLTETGLSLGTPHYMSPEQATGDLHVGPATDVYALGCVLYEMLVGEPPYTGSTPQAILGKIITGTPASVRENRGSVPPNVEWVIARALEKVPADRFRNAAGFVHALGDAGFRHGGTTATALADSSTRWRAVALSLAAMLVLSVGLAAWMMSGRAQGPKRSVAAEVAPGKTNVQISADGRSLFGYENGILWVRPVDELTWRSLEELMSTTGVDVYTSSPDGGWLAYKGVFGGTTQPIYRMALGGGGSEVIGSLPGGTGGLHWAEDDGIYYSVRDRVMRIEPTLGESEEVFAFPTEGTSADEAIFSPHVLPGGNGFLFQSRQRPGLEPRVLVGDLRTGTVREVAPLGSRPKYVATGHVAYYRRGALVAVPFDPGRLREVGEAVTVRADLAGDAFSISDDGTLIYGRVGSIAPSEGGFDWVSSSGEVTPTPPETTGGTQPRVSPDGRSVAYALNGHIWILELSSGVSRQFTFQGENASPVWSPDGRWLYFLSERAGTEGLDGFRKRSDGTGDAEALWTFAGEQALTSASSDGRWLVLHTFAGGGMVHTFDLEGGEGAVPRPYLGEGQVESTYEGALSPNGRWLAYTENVNGAQTLYARGFPEPSGQWRISGVGRSGYDAVWSPTGDAIYYSSDGVIVRTEVAAQDGVLTIGRTTVVFDREVPGGPGMNWDVHPDGDRMILTRGGASDRSYVLVTEFFEELKRLVPN
jgi:serine/threonine-protein kinase